MKKQEHCSAPFSGPKSPKKAYLSPTLKQYGAIHLTTQASGPSNGDNGMGMMA